MLHTDVISGLEVPPSSEGQRDLLLRPVLKAVVLLVLLLACLALVYLTPLRDHLRQIHVLCARIQGLGFGAVLVFVLSAALLVAIGCPRLLLYPIGGLAFGFIQGLLWTQLGTLIGSYATFLFVRWGGQEFVHARYPRLARLSTILEDLGFSTVLFLRLSPISSFFVNIFLGLTRSKHKDFLLGTLVGTTPQAVPATLMGSNALGVSLLTTSSSLSLGILGLIIVWILSAVYVRFSKSHIAQDMRTSFRHALEK
jgi:uncharacterized membrane protein YdjX (TVP38/TMEM64 family)